MPRNHLETYSNIKHDVENSDFRKHGAFVSLWTKVASIKHLFSHSVFLGNRTKIVFCTSCIFEKRYILYDIIVDISYYCIHLYFGNKLQYSHRLFFEFLPIHRSLYRLLQIIIESVVLFLNREIVKSAVFITTGIRSTYLPRH